MCQQRHFAVLVTARSQPVIVDQKLAWKAREILEEVERRIIVDMLEQTNWNQTEAAERFQIPLSTLNQKIKRLGIETRRRATAPRGVGMGYGEDRTEYSTGK